MLGFVEGISVKEVLISWPIHGNDYPLAKVIYVKILYVPMKDKSMQHIN
jgi:hypothetical protein